LKLTRHNGRSGKHGTYNPKHNDRRFDVDNSEHIDAQRTRQNVYWDCYRGVTTSENQGKDADKDFSFEDIERMYYASKYGDFVDAQNERNEKARHPERNRTVEDLLKNKRTCPEESIYQIGTLEDHVSGEVLLAIVNDFFGEMDRRFGSHVRILDWALHLDEGTPHIQERHVFECKNRYGELCPQQEKALEELEIPLPNPDKPKGKHNNRKQTFDAICRELLFEICEKHGLHLDREPEYGGRAYLEKQDYILAKQKEMLAQQEQALQEVTLKLEDAESLVEEIAETAYEKACEVVTDTVREETQKQDIAEISKFQKWATSPDRNYSQQKKDIINECLNKTKSVLLDAAKNMLEKIQSLLHNPKVKQANKEKVKEKAKESLLLRLQQHKEQIKSEDNAKKLARKQNMER
jgi:hypothetical protein